MGGGKEHVSERFLRLLALHRKPDGSEWGGEDLEDATGARGDSLLRLQPEGRIENPGLAKLGAIAGAMGFPPALWFGEESRASDDALVASLGDETLRSILEEAAKLRPKDRRLRGPGSRARQGSDTPVRQGAAIGADRPQHEIPYRHVRPPRRIVSVGGEGDPDACIVGNRAGSSVSGRPRRASPSPGASPAALGPARSGPRRASPRRAPPRPSSCALPPPTGRPDPPGAASPGSSRPESLLV
jgi:hypothetical protein